MSETMRQCRLIDGPGGRLIWDTVLVCENPECEYHRPAGPPQPKESI